MSTAPPRLYLIDASAYVHRAWQRWSVDWRDADGRPANAVRGFAELLLELLARERPRRVALAFDGPGSRSSRQRLYPAYKTHRRAVAPVLQKQFGRCQQLARGAGLATFVSDGVEADDVLATLACRARQAHVRHTVVGGDKDLAQSVRTGDQWYDPVRGLRLDPEGIRRRFGVLPHRLPDLLALSGDKSDNIPGIAGIGPRTAARLLARWGDLETLLAHTDAVASMRFRGAVRTARRLQTGAENARLGIRLTRAHHAPGLPRDPAALARTPPDVAALDSIAEALALDAATRQRWMQGFNHALR